MVSYLNLPKEDVHADKLINHEEFMADASDFLLKRNNQSFATRRETFDAYLDHMRKFTVGDVTPFGDLQYAQDATKEEQQKFAALRSTFERYEGKEDFFSYETLDKVGDYVLPILNPLESPSTVAGLFTGGTGAVAAKLASQGVKIGLKKLLNVALKDALKTVAVEGTTGALVGSVKGETGRLLGEGGNWKTGALKEGLTRGGAALLLGGGLSIAASKKGARLGAGILAKSERAEARFAAEAKKQTEEALKAGKAKKAQDPHAYINGATDAVEDTEVKFFADQLRRLDEDLVEKGINVKGGLGPEGLDEALVAGMTRETVNAVVAAGKQIADTIGWRSSDPSTRITERVANAISSGEVKDINGNTVEFSIDVLDGIAERFNLTREDLGALWAAEISEHARSLRAQRTIIEGSEATFPTAKEIADAKDIKDLITFVNDKMGSPATAELTDQITRVSEMGNTARKFFSDEIGGTLFGLNKLRLGLMTSKLATTIRNAANVGIRLPMHMIEYVGTGGSIVDAAKIPFELLFDKTEASILAIAFKRANPKQFKQIFRDAMDIEQHVGLGYVGGKLTALGRKANFINTFVDNTVKKTVLLGEFRKIARAQGKDLFDDVIAKGEFKRFLVKNRKEVEEAMGETLSLVYQKGYKRDSMGGKFISVFAQSKWSLLTSVVVPFPRYLANQTEFIYKHMPIIGAIQPLAKKTLGQGRVLKGGKLTQASIDFNKQFRKRMVQQVSGLGMMYTAMQFKIGQGPEMAWNEFKDSNGIVSDITALLGPFASTFFAVDMWYRMNEGNINSTIVPHYWDSDKKTIAGDSSKLTVPMSSKDAIRSGIQAFTGIQARTGTGLHFLDSFVDNILAGELTSKDPDTGETTLNSPAWKNTWERVQGDWWNTFTIPAGMFTELQATFDPEGRKLMDNSRIDLNQYFWNIALRSLPNTEALRNTSKFLFGSEESFTGDLIEGLRGQQVEQEFPTGDRTRRTPFVRELTGISTKYGFRGKPTVDKEATRLGVDRQLLTFRDKSPTLKRTKKDLLKDELPKVVGEINKKVFREGDKDLQKYQLEKALRNARKEVNRKAKIVISSDAALALEVDEIKFRGKNSTLQSMVARAYENKYPGKNIYKDKAWAVGLDMAEKIEKH